MASFLGGTAVKRGYYIEGRHFEITTVARDGDALPGGPERRWLRLPVMAVVAAAPALGGLFVISLPFLGFGLAAYAIGKRVASLVGAGAREVGASLAPEVRPGEAYLTCKPEKGEASKPAAKGEGEVKDAKLEALEKEVEQARKRRE
jgi:hypothetical protein